MLPYIGKPKEDRQGKLKGKWGPWEKWCCAREQKKNGDVLGLERKI